MFLVLWRECVVYRVKWFKLIMGTLNEHEQSALLVREPTKSGGIFVLAVS